MAYVQQKMSHMQYFFKKLMIVNESALRIRRTMLCGGSPRAGLRHFLCQIRHIIINLLGHLIENISLHHEASHVLFLLDKLRAVSRCDWRMGTRFSFAAVACLVAVDPKPPFTAVNGGNNR